MEPGRDKEYRAWQADRNQLLTVVAGRLEEARRELRALYRGNSRLVSGFVTDTYMHHWYRNAAVVAGLLALGAAMTLTTGGFAAPGAPRVLAYLTCGAVTAVMVAAQLIRGKRRSGTDWAKFRWAPPLSGKPPNPP